MIQANKDFGPRKLEWRQKELLSDCFWQYTPTKPEEVSSLMVPPKGSERIHRGLPCRLIEH